MKRMIGMLLLTLTAAAARADLPTLRWDIETSRPAAQLIEVFRNETVIFDVRYLNYGTPLSLADAWDVVLRYRSGDMAEDTYYAVTGAVVNASAGLVRVIWTPEAVGHTNSYVYTLAAKTVGGDIMRGLGAIRVRNVVQGSVTNMPRAVTTSFNWGSVEHINIGSAPFLSVADILSLENAIATLNSGKVDRTEWALTNAMLFALIAQGGGGGGGPTTMAGDVTGPSTNASVIGLRGLPISLLSDPQDGHALKYDAATQSIMLGPVASEVGGSYSNVILVTGTNTRFSVGNNQAGLYRVVRPGNIPSLAVNVEGTEVVYYDLLGMTMRFGTLSLLNSNLTANLATYDGGASQPAQSWQADRTLGRYRQVSNGKSGEAFAVGGETVWRWDRDGIQMAPGKTIQGSATAIEVDPTALKTSGWYVAHQDAGPWSLTVSNATPARLLTNGYRAASWQTDGAWIQLIEQLSFDDGASWGDADYANGPVYWRLFAVSEMPGFETNGAVTVSNIAVQSWSVPGLAGRVSDLESQVLRVDTPAAGRDVANKGYVDAFGGTNWAAHPASTDVRMAGRRLMFDARWSMVAAGPYTALSYAVDSLVTTNRWRLDYDGDPVLTVQLGGLVPLAVSSLQVLTGETDTVWVMMVPTNNVTAAPRPQISTNLVNWTGVTPYTGSYPASTNGAYTLWWTNDYGAGAYFRAVQAGTSVVERIVAGRPMDVGSHGLVLNGVQMLHSPNAVAVLPSATNIVINRSHGPQVALVVTNPTCMIRFDLSGWATSDIGRVRMDLIRGTNAVSLDTNTIAGTITNSAVSSIEFDKQWSRMLWRVIRQW